MKKATLILRFAIMAICISNYSVYAQTIDQDKKQQITTLEMAAVPDSVTNKQTNKSSYVNGVKAVKVVMNGRKANNIGFKPESPSPNPFIQETHLRFQLPKEGMVIMELTDLTGKLLKTCKEMKEKGDQEMVWDGRDFSGNALKAGTYLCTLEYAGFKKTCKLTKIE
jgi:FlgD Ig-like domain